jgi:murein DD-endopeptidase MepM/ murein hydrolase activator NlpD
MKLPAHQITGAAMTHILQRSALILLASTALCATPALARTHHARKHPAAEADQADRASYTVKKGDTLASIADKLDTSVPELMKDNRLRKRSLLQPGQVLKGPVVLKSGGAKGGSAKGGGGKAAAATTYKVAHGDTLFSISQRLHVSVDDLRTANHLSARGQIHAGQELKLPGSEEAAAEPTPAKAEGRGARGRKGRGAQPAAEPVAEESAGSGGGRVVTVEARGETYKARKGDTLARIAGRLGVGVSALKRLNHVKGNAVHAGQVYHGAAFAEHIYTAAPGDTVPSIAQRFGVSVASLRAENEMSKRVVSVRPGQKVYLPDGYRDRSAPSEERFTRGYPQPAMPSRGDTNLPSHPIPYAPGGTAPAQGPAAQTPPSTPGPTDAQISQLGKDRFTWPLTGTILSDFGPKTGGQRNDGINIQADAGAPVHAAAEGEVIYAGDQVPGFGNLILLKHADGWATVYAYLSKIEVKAQQKVTQGQEIGQAGSSGGVPEPQLHFEVRYTPTPAERARSVDPKLVLPK